MKSLLEEESPLNDLQSDIDSQKNLNKELRLSRKEVDEIEALFKNYINALVENIDRRFADSSNIIVAFGVFDPLGVPGTNSESFKKYGDEHLETIAEHLFQNDLE